MNADKQERGVSFWVVSMVLTGAIVLFLLILAIFDTPSPSEETVELDFSRIHLQDSNRQAWL